MVRRCLFPLAALALGVVPAHAQTAAPATTATTVSAATPIMLTAADAARLTELGKTYTRWFLAGKADSLLSAFTPESAENAGGIDGVREMMNQVAERGGVEVKVTDEKLTRRNGYPQFWHAGQFSDFTSDELVIRWVLFPDGKIRGAGIGPKAATPAPDPN